METLYRKVAVSERLPEIDQKVIGISYGMNEEKSTVCLCQSGYWYSFEWSSEIDQPEFWLEEIPDNSHQIEKLEAEKKEFLEALEKVKKWGNQFGIGYAIYTEVNSLIKKHKQ